MDEKVWKVSDGEERRLIEYCYYQTKKSHLPISDAAAENRFINYRGMDPFIEIEPALLNSADIFRYECATGMIYPFYVEDLKGASYEVRIKGRVIWWNKEGNKQEKELEDYGDSFELEPNSIAFVTLEPFLRIPDYLALRFNLKIVHIYKGLLLGTGPLVDPGFQGRLSIPLHNLTINTYRFKYNDPLIQLEFTKLSKNAEWNREIRENEPDIPVYKRNWIKPGRTVEYYVDRALEGSGADSVRSSIPEELKKAEGVIAAIKTTTEDALKESQERVVAINKRWDEAVKFFQTLNVVSVIIVLFTVFTAFITMSYHSVQRDEGLRKEYESRIDKAEEGFEARLKELKVEYEETIRSLTEEMEILKTQMSNNK